MLSSLTSTHAEDERRRRIALVSSLPLGEVVGSR